MVKLEYTFVSYFCWEQQFPTILQKDAYDFVFLKFVGILLSVFEAESLHVPDDFFWPFDHKVKIILSFFFITLHFG